MRNLLYKVDTNFFETPLNKGFQRVLFIGTVGAISVFKAVYIDKRELKCACVGGDSSVPLGFVSLSENLFMIAGALIMLFL